MREARAELVAPPPDGFIAEEQAAFVLQLFSVMKAAIYWTVEGPQADNL